MDKCIECGCVLTDDMINVNMCWECGHILNPNLLEENEDLIEPMVTFKESVSNIVQEQQNIEKAMNNKINQHLITTGYNFEGYRIISYLDVVSGETVLGTGMLSEISASVSDLFGAKSEKFTEKIGQAKKIAKRAMIENSIKLGGNAIIGMHFELLNFMGNMIGVCGEGTAVIIEKIEEDK